MPVKAQVVTVGTDPTRLDVASDVHGTVAMGQHLLVRNTNGSTSVFVGGGDVTTADGFEVTAGESLSVDLTRGDSLYAVVASGTVDCAVLQAGV